MTTRKKALVLFKRDLRIFDHRPLLEASQKNYDILPVYTHEPDYWKLDDSSQRHWAIISKALVDLNTYLKKLGQELYFHSGDMIEKLSDLYEVFPFEEVFAHEETGNLWTFNRDKKLRSFFKERKMR